MCLHTTRWQVATLEGYSRTARPRPQRSGGRIAQGRKLLNRSRAGFGCVYKPGWLWPLRMAKRVSERATRGGEHGGVGTPHARGASGEALGVGSDEASSISFCLRARWLVSTLTRRCGDPPAHLPSGRGSGYGGASEREIGQPNPIGGGFVSGMRSGRPNSLRGRCVEIKLFQKKQSTTWGVPELEIRNPKRDAKTQRRCSCLCAPAGLFGARFQRREAAHWAIGRLQASSG